METEDTSQDAASGVWLGLFCRPVLPSFAVVLPWRELENAKGLIGEQNTKLTRFRKGYLTFLQGSKKCSENFPVSNLSQSPEQGMALTFEGCFRSISFR